MSKTHYHTSDSDDNTTKQDNALMKEFIQELKEVVGLSPDQIFQLLMKKHELLIEKEKTYQKLAECKILLESIEDLDSKKRKQPFGDGTPSSKKKMCNHQQQDRRKSLQDLLCADELVNILEFLPDFGAFKLARVSKSLNAMVLNNINRIKRIHLMGSLKYELIESFVNSVYFQNIDSCIIDFDISCELANSILQNSDNLRELKLSLETETDDEGVIFSNYPDSSFKKLETLHIKSSCSDCMVVLDHVNLFNLTDLKIDGINYYSNSDYLNEKVNNVRKLHLKRVVLDFIVPTKMKSMTHLTLEKCKLSDDGFHSLLLNAAGTLEHISISKCQRLEHHAGDQLESNIVELPFLTTLSISDLEPDDTDDIDAWSGELDFTTLLESKLSNLTNLKLDNLNLWYATALSENTSITLLKTLSIENISKSGALKILMESDTFFNRIERIYVNAGKLDANILLYISNNSLMFRNLKELVVLNGYITTPLNGYQSFFTSVQHFNNLEKLVVPIPRRMEDLNYLAQSQCFPNLKILYVTGGGSKKKEWPPTNFFPFISNNTNLRQVRELGLSFFSDSSIEHVRSMENIKTIRFRRDMISAWGMKKVEEWGVKWSFIDS